MNQPQLRVAVLSDHERLLGVVDQLRALRGFPSVADRRTASLEELVDILEEGRFDAVLFDSSVVQESPLEAVRTIRGHIRTVPIIFVGAEGELGQAGEADEVLRYDELTPRSLVRCLACTVERRFLISKIHRLTEDGPALSEQPFRNLIEANADGILILDQAGSFRFVNPAAEELLGVSEDDLIGQPFGFPLLTGEATEIVLHPAKQSETASPEPRVAEMRVVETNWEGEVMYLASLRDVTDRNREAAELRDYRDRLEELVGERTSQLSRANAELEDRIDAVQRAQEALVRSENRSRAIVSAMPDLMFRLSREGYYLDYAAPDDSLLLVAPETIIGSHVRDAGFGAEEVADILEAISRSLDTGEVETYAYSAETDGQTRHFEARIVPSGTDEVLCIVQDVTEREAARQALQRSEQHYRGVFQSAPVGIFHTTPEGKVLDVNPALARIYGYDSPEDFIETVNQTSIAERLYVDPDTRPSQVDEALAGGDWASFENRYYRKDGSIFTGRMMFRIVRDDHGNVDHLEGFVEDITDRKRLEEARELQTDALEATAHERTRELTDANTRLARLASERLEIQEELEVAKERYKSLYNNPIVGLFRTNLTPDGKGAIQLLDCNEQTARMLGYESREELQSSYSIEKHLSRRDRDELRRQLFATGEVANYQLKMARADGTEIWVSYSGRARVEEGHVDGAIMDITAQRKFEETRKQLEEHVRMTQKLESLEKLAGGVAHHFNNLLQGIRGNAELALMDLPADSVVAEKLGHIVSSAQRATGLSNQMLSYAGRGTYSLQCLNLNELLRDSENLIRVSVETGVEVKLELADDVPEVEGDASQLRQALVNLVTNAAEAVEGRDDATITIATGSMVCDHECMERAFLYGEVCEGAHSFFSVEDTGPGMDDATRAKVFDPFFSTKHTGRGLGLAAVLGIVRGHGGMIRIDTALDQGTKFTVLLPEAPVAEREERPTSDTRAPAAATGKVLVVDDEHIVIEVTRQMLERLGLDTLTAESGREALELYDAHEGDITLVLLDIVMPGMDGSEVFRELKKRDESLNIVLCSGYNEERVAGQLGEQRPAAFIQKPFDYPKLKSTIEEIVGTPPRSPDGAA